MTTRRHCITWRYRLHSLVQWRMQPRYPWRIVAYVAQLDEGALVRAYRLAPVAGLPGSYEARESEVSPWQET